MDINKFIIFWYIYKECNLQCDYCFRMDSEAQNILPNLQQIDEILNHLATFPRFTLSLLGGEITLWKDLPYLVNKALLLPNIEQIQITTNGQYLDESWIGNEKILINLFIHPKYFTKYGQLLITNITPIIVYDLNSHDLIRALLLFSRPNCLQSMKLKLKDTNIVLDDATIHGFAEVVKEFNIKIASITPTVKKRCSTGYQLRFDYDGSIYHTHDMCLLEKDVNIYKNPKDLEYKKYEFNCLKELCYNDCTTYGFNYGIKTKELKRF